MSGMSSAVAAGAFGLARRVTGDPAAAVRSVEAAAVLSHSVPDLIREVREQARARRVAAARPPAQTGVLAGIPADEWDVLEQVALRGRTLTEAAEDLSVARDEALYRLRRGLLAARRQLGLGEDGDNPGATGFDGLRSNRSARVLCDAT